MNPSGKIIIHEGFAQKQQLQLDMLKSFLRDYICRPLLFLSAFAILVALFAWVLIPWASHFLGAF